MNLKRIAYVLKVFPKISETFVASELAELRRRGIDLRILSLLPPKGEIRHDIVAEAGLYQITCYGVERFGAVIKEFRPQLIHAHFATESTAAAIELATDQDLCFTFTAHGYDIHRKPPPDFAARARVARAVVTVSQSNANYIVETFRVPREHIHVIPCAIDVNKFRPGNRASAAKEPPLIVCVARLVEVKNLRLLLESCAQLRKRGLIFHCVLLGDGPCRQELEARRAELGLNEFVKMPGSVEQSEVCKWWQKASVALLTSHNEGMPVSLMEAAACGVPAVSTAVGGVPELVQDGVTGLLANPGDAQGLAVALERLLTDHELRKRQGAAARQRAEQMFSVTHQVDQLITLWSGILSQGTESGNGIFVSDPSNAAEDPAMPGLAQALDPAVAKREFKRRLPRLSGENGQLRLKAIRVIRHKLGKRCVVEYDVQVQKADIARKSVTLIGKTRAHRFGKEGYRVLERLWRAGFDYASSDHISVPEPIGMIPRFQMWFQSKVPGETSTTLLSSGAGIELMRRVAEAIHKLHQAKVPTERQHTMADELRILRECLAKVAADKPEWKGRLEAILAACDRLGASVPESSRCGIHRDFYPAQVIVDRERIYLIDFDLYCLGDPALDIGNFIGHMTEQSLRETGDGSAWAEEERALEQRFVELSGESRRKAIHAFTILTLVRHIYLSTQFAARQPLTSTLMDLCESRLGIS